MVTLMTLTLLKNNNKIEDKDNNNNDEEGRIIIMIISVCIYRDCKNCVYMDNNVVYLCIHYFLSFFLCKIYICILFDFFFSFVVSIIPLIYFVFIPPSLSIFFHFV